MPDSIEQYRDAERLDLASASKLERVVACPGCQNLENDLPPEAFESKPDAEDEWAKSGTRIHEAFRTGNTLELSAEETDIYNQGVKFEQAIVERWMDDKALEECEEGPRELRVYLRDPWNWPEPISSGQLDRHYYNQERGLLLVTDLKSGWNPNLPPSPKSWQLKFYGVAAWKEEYSWVKEVRVGYCKAQDEYTVRDFCDYQEQDLIYSWESIRFHLWESRQPDAPRHPGPHCSFCPCKPYCVEAGAYSTMPAVIARNALQAAPVELMEKIAKMTPADLYKVWDASTIIGKIITAVKDRLKGMTDAELMELGIARGKGAMQETVLDMPELFRVLCEHFGEEAVLKCLNIGKGKMVELIQAGKGYNKAMAENWYASTTEPYVKREPGEKPLRRLK